MTKTGRLGIAAAASLPLGTVMLASGLLALAGLVEQFLAGIFDLSQASISSVLNPVVLLGLQSPGGSGGPLDALVGGPGAPGGTLGRYVVTFLAAAITFGAFSAVQGLWGWALTDRPTSTDEGPL